jgi:hypothetical protein
MHGEMSELAESFPTLRNRPGVSPWDPESLDRWAAGSEPSHGARCAAQFVLHVWNAYVKDWKSGRFDMMEAVMCWDREHRAAFSAWTQKPWWP